MHGGRFGVLDKIRVLCKHFGLLEVALIYFLPCLLRGRVMSKDPGKPGSLVFVVVGCT